MTQQKDKRKRKSITVRITPKLKKELDERLNNKKWEYAYPTDIVIAALKNFVETDGKNICEYIEKQLSKISETRSIRTTYTIPAGLIDNIKKIMERIDKKKKYTFTDVLIFALEVYFQK